MRKTRDLIELLNSVSTDLPDEKRHEKICNLILEEFQTLKGKDLVPYLSELVLYFQEQYKLVIQICEVILKN